MSNAYVQLAHGYLTAVQALDADVLSTLIAPTAKAQFLPSAPLGPLGELKDKDGFLGNVRLLKEKVFKDGVLPMEVLEITDASAAGLVIVHTKAKDAFTAAGIPYTNEYLIMLWMDEVDGELRITRIQEFFDSIAVLNLGV
ncbi:hypothetical protein EXIGLDRAFT_727263 [Exidia glandulosa HHB12029]|uniref:SnoaL-like domain-containing protein n=1 Tax=Exidia glandulosa HHB12029 TaxID=1314781 RepID=A0A165DEU6_EXIGL|nr:hypothetical protein EXIGLDRAFT_727263 [Exidia glandulosa HHB12029]